MTDEGFFSHYSQVIDWPWKYFTPEELAQKGGGSRMGQYSILIVPSFMDKLEALRKACDFPFVINSGYRSPVYNDQISSTGLNGVHTKGRAVDINLYGERALQVIEKARQHGFTGIGISQAGPWHSRFIHLDDLSPDEGQRPWIWAY
jgi:uncharacterized protein YcbK (DUF882 family)